MGSEKISHHTLLHIPEEGEGQGEGQEEEGWPRLLTKTQQHLQTLVTSHMFEQSVTLCILLNTVFLALEHHGMSESLQLVLDLGNKVGRHRGSQCHSQ